MPSQNGLLSHVVVLNPQQIGGGGGGGGGPVSIVNGAPGSAIVMATNPTGTEEGLVVRPIYDGSIINSNLVQVSGAALTLGQKISANSLPVVLASDQSNINVVGTLTNNNAAPIANNVGVLPAVASTTAPTYVDGNQVLLSTDLTGSLRVTVSGSSTSDVNLVEVGGAAVTLGQKVSTASIPVVIASDQSDVGVNIDEYGGTATTLGTKVAASSIPVTLASDQPDININVDQYGGTATTLGQKLMAASMPVVLASDQSDVGVVGTLTNNNATPTANNVGVLPAVASITAPTYVDGNQVLLSTDLTGSLRVTTSGVISDVNLTEVGGAAVTLGQKVSTASIPVVIASDQSDVGVNIDEYGGTATTLGTKVAASSIPVTLASDQPDININVDKYGGTAVTLGQKVMASSQPVVIASDQSSISVGTQGSLTDHSGTITTGGTSQTLMAANASRKYILIQNVSTADLWFNFGVAAVVSQPSIRLQAGDSFVMESNFISTQALNIIGATTSQAFSSKEG